MSKEGRDQALKRREEVAEKTRSASVSARDVLEALGKERRELTREYLECLPTLIISRCPFCQESVKWIVDVFGLDGPWWEVFGPRKEPEACPHYFVTLGALNLLEKEPVDGSLKPSFEIYAGPEVPFIVPRLLDLPNMNCIISTVQIVEGRYQIYFISYFSDPPTDASGSHQPWLRNQFTFQEGGRNYWDVRNDVWEFDLEKWMERKPPKIYWIDPSDSKNQLKSSERSTCPYLKISGNHKPAIIQIRKVRRIALPDGSPVGHHE